MFHIRWNGILFLSAGWNSRRSISGVLTYETPIRPLPSHLTGPCCICPSFSPYGPSYSQTGFQTSNFLSKLGYNIQQSLLFLSQFLNFSCLGSGHMSGPQFCSSFIEGFFWHSGNELFPTSIFILHVISRWVFLWCLGNGLFPVGIYIFFVNNREVFSSCHFFMQFFMRLFPRGSFRRVCWTGR